MKTTFNFSMTRKEVRAMRSLTKTVNSSLSALELPKVEVTIYDKLRLALGGKKTAGGEFDENGVHVKWTATASKADLSIELEAEMNEAYMVEVCGMYEDAFNVFLPAIVSAVAGLIGAQKLFEAKADKRALRLQKAVQ